MSSLQTEHTDTVEILIILYAIQTYMGVAGTTGLNVDIWIDNAEVLAWGNASGVGVGILLTIWFWITTYGE